MKLVLLLLSLAAFGFGNDTEITAKNNLVLTAGQDIQVNPTGVVDAQRPFEFPSTLFRLMDSGGTNYVSLSAGASVTTYDFIFPLNSGSADECMFTDGAGNHSYGPCNNFEATNDNRLLRSDTVDGDEIQESGITVDDSDNMSGIVDIDVDSIDGTAIANYVLTTASQVLTAKDYDGGTASNTSRITIPQDTKANLDLLTRKEGTIVYGTDDDTVYIDDGTALNALAGGGASFVAFRGQQNSGQSFNDSVATDVVFNIEDFDTDASFDGTTFTAPRDLTCVFSGGFRFGNAASWAANNAIIAQLSVDGSTRIVPTSQVTGTYVRGSYSFSSVEDLTMGQQVRLNVSQNNNANTTLSLTPASLDNWFAGFCL